MSIQMITIDEYSFITIILYILNAKQELMSFQWDT